MIINGKISDYPNSRETVTQTKIRLEAAKQGILLFRNNVGVLFNDKNVPVRYGLANDSPTINKRIKSGDLIGVETVVIDQSMVGKKIGRFVSIEVKRDNWKYTGDEREKAQLNWITLINDYGGRAFFATNTDNLK